MSYWGLPVLQLAFECLPHVELQLPDEVSRIAPSSCCALIILIISFERSCDHIPFDADPGATRWTPHPHTCIVLPAPNDR